MKVIELIIKWLALTSQELKVRPKGLEPPTV